MGGTFLQANFGGAEPQLEVTEREFGDLASHPTRRGGTEREGPFQRVRLAAESGYLSLLVPMDRITQVKKPSRLGPEAPPCAAETSVILPQKKVLFCYGCPLWLCFTTSVLPLAQRTRAFIHFQCAQPWERQGGCH